MQDEIVFAAHHRGPPGAGNGGYVCGMLADRIDGPAEVTLRLPTPLGRPLQVLRTGETVELRDAGALVAVARPMPLDLHVPGAPRWEDCLAATERGGSFADSEFAGCFSCGRQNPHGVKVWAGTVAGRAMTAAAWRPEADHAGPDGFLPTTHLWAALDCPGAGALLLGRDDLLLMTGRMRGVADRDCRVDADYRVIGWPIAVEGRKHFCGTAVIDATDRVRARALTTWIAVG